MNRVEKIEVYVSVDHCEHSRQLLRTIDEICSDAEKRRITVSDILSMEQIPPFVEYVPTLIVNNDVRHGRKQGHQCFSFVNTLYNKARSMAAPSTAPETTLTTAGSTDQVGTLNKKPTGASGSLAKLSRDKTAENAMLEQMASKIESQHQDKKSGDVDLEKMLAARKM